MSSIAIPVPKPRPPTDDHFEKLASEFIDWLETIPEPLRWKEEPEMIALMFIAERLMLSTK